jgi:DNA polymerase III epsilon subunit family exonuclease
MRIKDAAFTIFDFETTGLYPYSGDRICEIGAVRIDSGRKRKKTFHSMINPGRPISPGAFNVNGITEEMLDGAPKIEKAMPAFMKFIKDSVLVAYNAGFDLGFLECAMGEEINLLDSYLIVDALGLARKLFPGLGRYGLGPVCDALNIRVDGEHRAMADALMTAKVFEKELKVLEKMGVRAVADIAYVRTKKAASVNRVKDHKTMLIEEAIRARKKLNIVYRSVWTDAVSSRTIEPKEIRYGYDKAYLIAHCRAVNDQRNFRLDGILEIEETGE